LILLFTYVSPERSVIYETGNGNGINILNNRITAILSDFPDVAFLLAGDFNARTKHLDDYIPSDDVDYIFQCNTAYPVTHFVCQENRFGSALIDLCCTHGVHIFNGRLYGDTDGHCTCTANDGKSLADYVIGLTELFNCCTDFYFESEDFSDHFPACCRLTFQCTAGYDETMNQSTLNRSCSYKWKESCVNTFIESFSHLFPRFSSNLIAANCIEKLEEFNALYKQAGMSMPGSIQVNTTQPDWWDDECSWTKRTNYKYLRRFRASNLQSDFDLYISQRRLFKTV